ncbi:MAG TPA: hypothetical protein VMM18_05505 [Gemmatimonadaceae bacterium]|nr:hypothetical protein [Gemmatimonadaceae bacterium]
MKTLQLIATGTAFLITGACNDGHYVLDPATPELGVQNHSPDASATAAHQVETAGSFAAFVDFSTLTLTPRGQNCLLTVDGQLVFTGTIEGTATGTTSALVFAPCSDVATTPPGTFPDVFKSELAFEGTVDGEPVRADVLYMGRVQPGGRIDGRLVFHGDVRGELEAEAIVAVGGEYRGSVVVK